MTLSLLMAGCAGGSASLGKAPSLLPTSQYSLQVEQGLDRIALAVHDTGVSPNQQAALSDLVQRYARAPHGDIVIEAPSGDDAVSAAMAWRVKDTLEAVGVPANRIRVASYNAPDPRAPVLAGFETVEAVVPRCGQEWGSLGRTGDNRPSSNFGCAVTANLASQISNPRDMVAPREMTAPDAARRAVVFDKFVQGQATSATPEPLINKTRISQAVE